MKNFILKTIFLLIGLITNLTLFSQTTVNGIITDETGDPLIGANVLVAGTSEGAITDLDGNFSFQTSKVPPFDIEVAYTGFSE